VNFLKNIKITNMIYIKTYNESIRHLLKPKSEEDISKSIEKLSPSEKLQYACEYGVMWLFKQALDKGANPVYQDNFCIRYASANGHYTIVKVLLSFKDVDPSDLNNVAIQVAHYYKHKNIVELLLNDKRVRSSLPPFLLKRYENYVNNIHESYKLLKINEFFEDDVKYWALYAHIYDNYFSKVNTIKEVQELKNELIDDMDYRMITAIEFFAKYRIKVLKKSHQVSNESIRHLLKPKSKENMIMSLNNIKSNKKKVKHIIDYNLIDADIISKDEFKKILNSIEDQDFKIKCCIESNNIEILDDLIKNNEIFINELVIREYLELIEDKVISKDNDMVKYIFNYLYTRDKHHILSVACDYNNLDIVKYAVEKGKLNINCHDCLLLLEPCIKGYTDIVEYLLQKGIDVHKSTIMDGDDKDDRYLWEASRFGHYNIVKLLLKYGANPLSNNSKAIISAKKAGHQSIHKLLIKYANKIRFNKIKKIFKFGN